MERSEYINRNLFELTRTWFMRASLWGCVLFILFGVLDYVATPDNFRRFMLYRVVISGMLLICYFLVRVVPQKYLLPLLLAAVIASAVMLELMILGFGGHESPYYVGMILLGISVMGFIPARLSFHLAVAGTIYVIYLVPILAIDPDIHHNMFYIANFFMALIFATMLIMRYLSSASLVKEYGLRYDLERYRHHLEAEVADRTTELAKVVENLQREIVERKRAEEERRHLQEQFLQSQKMESIGRLAGGVAHDFNNILTAILSYTELILMKMPGDHPQRGYLNVIKQAAEKAAALTHQLLAFSRKQLLFMKAVNLNSIVSDMAMMLRRLIGEDVQLVLRLASRGSMLADVTQIEQVLMNLVVNARDAMPGGGRLLIETADAELDEASARAYAVAQPGDYIVLSVSDEGMGMPKDIRDRIFEPFFSTKERGKGTGLGLATVYGIIKQHNGHILVDSEPGKGTMFRVYWPVTSAPADGRAARGDLDMPGGSETILVVEDEETVRTLVTSVLQALGYRVLAASSGEEALARYSPPGVAIDLLLTDMVMVGMNGRELAARMRSQCPGLAVLFMTGYSEDIVSPGELQATGDLLIQKPLTPALLAQKVREILIRRRAKEDLRRAP